MACFLIRYKSLECSCFYFILQIVFGHSKQLWGLAVHPDDELFATAGYDKNISLWKRHALLWSTQV